ncbi:PTS-dependent dihydroxyacetone kinase phosphotransferase subunit DhaM [Soehngenia longivitae]|uniref:phosphoenolpyruvate--glycerone phosphotransferase n=1 Tax=Soehngenia longivitae TaxID=2562294 RepID=A0A4Z0D8C3_9FIRM|nr:dihydroxyacetone kinase phosphoryl donor subunit DhaM [Soehngenia longivitae]TFZ41145.1 PTS-dependent dihydroxyacetone kinase phosphotransferase subunit DhaM [Soehngenia longivitae]
MVGIVIVSHSNKISEGVVDMCREMAGKEQKIISAGGLDDYSLGTDAVKIANAIENADSGDGVLVFADLGSAILSTEMAIDILKDSSKDIRVEIADAPIVEGAIAGSIEAYIGGNLESCLTKAEEVKIFSKLNK